MLPILASSMCLGGGIVVLGAGCLLGTVPGLLCLSCGLPGIETGVAYTARWGLARMDWFAVVPGSSDFISLYRQFLPGITPSRGPSTR